MLFAILEALLFYFIYLEFGLKYAIVVMMITYIVRLSTKLLKRKKLFKLEIFGIPIILLIGLLTIKFNSLIFLQWKLTIVYLSFAVGLWISKILFDTDLIKKLFGQSPIIIIQEKYWYNLNVIWTCFFILNAVINTAIIFWSTESSWMEFKTFWSTGLFVIMAFYTPFYMYLKHEK